MKNLFIFFGIIILTGIITLNLVSCNTQYKKEKLAELKEKNKIDTKNQEIRNNLEWIAPQEKPFNKVDDKYYFVIWQNPDLLEFKITKFFNNSLDAFKNNKIIDTYNNYNLVLTRSPNIFLINDLGIKGYFFFKGYFIYNLSRKYFKSVYRWNLNIQEPDLILYENGNVKIK